MIAAQAALHWFVHTATISQLAASPTTYLKGQKLWSHPVKELASHFQRPSPVEQISRLHSDLRSKVAGSIHGALNMQIEMYKLQADQSCRSC